MAENIIPISVISTIFVSVIAGLLLHKAKKEYVEKHEFKEAIERSHVRIDGCEDDIKGLKKTTTILEHEIKGVKEDISEIKFEVKDTKTIMNEMNKTVTRMSVLMEENRKLS